MALEAPKVSVAVLWHHQRQSIVDAVNSVLRQQVKIPRQRRGFGVSTEGMNSVDA